jgi:hypothetical protein
MSDILIGVSACLLGEHVRYDGGATWLYDWVSGLNGTVSKTVVGLWSTEGSNPSPSADYTAIWLVERKSEICACRPLRRRPTSAV